MIKAGLPMNNGIIINPSGVDQPIPFGGYSGVVGSGVFKAVSLIAGDIPIFQDTYNKNTASASYAKVYEVTTLMSGTVRVSFDLANGGDGQWAYGKVYINGIAVGTERKGVTGASVYTTFTEDFTVNANDKIQIYAYALSNSTYVKNFIIKASVSPTTIVVNM